MQNERALSAELTSSCTTTSLVSSQVSAESEPLQEIKPWMDLLIQDMS